MPGGPLGADEAPVEPWAELQVLVAGSGVGGLALAGFLRQRGLTPVVVGGRGERPAAPDGAVVLSRRARGLVGELCLAGRLDERAVPVDSWVRRTRDGETARGACDADGPVAVDRAALREILSQVVPDGLCRADSGVESLDIGPEAVEVTLSDGVRERFDVVVGADGDSAIRAAVSDDAGRTSRAARTWCVPVDDGQLAATVVDHWGERAVLTRLPGVETDWCRLTRLTDGDVAGHGRFGEALAAAGVETRCPAGAERFAAEAAARDVRRFESTLWADGRAAFVGGAARTVHPAVGAGASAALVDAWTLAAALTHESGAVERRAAEYASRREGGRATASDAPGDPREIEELRAARLRWLRRLDRAADEPR